MSSVCVQLIVVVVTLSLSDVACQTVHNINISGDLHSIRQRRQARTLTQEQISEIVDLHNERRAREGADNMEVMMWNTSLASMSAIWAARCHWGHPGYNYPEYNTIGQNLYLTTGNAVNLRSAMDLWYNEKDDYTYETLSCVPGKKCGHYTQVVWAWSSLVGCAIHRCASMTGISYAPTVFFVCNYSPSGNYVSLKPFTKGPACSKCGSGAGWCKDKLCNSNCSSGGTGCSCAAICYNCAKLDPKTCRCNCTNGWHGVDCNVSCVDTHRWCNKNPGWPPYTCNTGYVRRGCPAMCGLCTPDPNAVAGQCAPATYGHPSEQGIHTSDVPLREIQDSAQTMFLKYQQSTMIFVMVIITFIICSYDTM